MQTFFVTNQYLNKRFPLAAIAESSLDKEPEADFYLKELSSRFLAALGIGDTETMKQLQERLAIHRACREAHGILETSHADSKSRLEQDRDTV